MRLIISLLVLVAFAGCDKSATWERYEYKRVDMSHLQGCHPAKQFDVVVLQSTTNTQIIELEDLSTSTFIRTDDIDCDGQFEWIYVRQGRYWHMLGYIPNGKLVRRVGEGDDALYVHARIDDLMEVHRLSLMLLYGFNTPRSPELPLSVNQRRREISPST